MIGVYVRVDEPSMSMEKRERIVMVVPVPPISNHRFKGTVRRAKTGKRYAGFRRSAASSHYQRAIRAICQFRKIIPLKGKVAMTVDWYRSRRAGDLPDRWKDLCDALQSKQKDPRTKKLYDTGRGVFFDDAQIADWHVRSHDNDPNNPRCELQIWSMDETKERNEEWKKTN